jgi:RNA polymerase sigma-70 factor, ECF subfamily
MGASAPESNGRSQNTEALYREHRAAVATLCRSLLHDRSEAEDATQQVFLSAHRALLNGAAPREPLAWLLVVARHECYARFRQRPVSPVPGEDLPDEATPDTSLHVMRARELETVWDEVRRMPRAQREAFLLREIRGLSYGQLADELSLSAPSVRSLLSRARTRLRHRLRDVTAGLGTAAWVQPLVRLVAGGDGTSPLPAATKAAAIGVGTLALVGGGSLSRGVAHQPPRTPVPSAAGHRAHVRVSRPALPAGLVAATAADRRTPSAGRSMPEHSRQRNSGSGPREGSGDLATSSDGGVTGSGHDGSDGTTAVTQSTTDGSGSGSTSTTSGRDGSRDGSSGSGSSGPGPGSGSDGGSGTTTTVTTPGSDGSGSGGRDSGHGGG